MSKPLFTFPYAKNQVRNVRTTLLQMALCEAGCGEGIEIEGRFGDITEACLKKRQRQLRVKSTGILDKATAEAWVRSKKFPGRFLMLTEDDVALPASPAPESPAPVADAAAEAPEAQPEAPGSAPN